MSARIWAVLILPIIARQEHKNEQDKPANVRDKRKKNQPAGFVLIVKPANGHGHAGDECAQCVKQHHHQSDEGEAAHLSAAIIDS